MNNEFLKEEYKKINTLEDILNYFYNVRKGLYKTENDKYNKFLLSNYLDSVYKVVTNQYNLDDDLYEKIYRIRMDLKRKYVVNNALESEDMKNRKDFFSTILSNNGFIYMGNAKEGNVKLYLTFGEENYVENIEKIIEILYKVYIKNSKNIGQCKFRFNISNDNVTIRLSSEQYKYFMELINQNIDILTNSDMKPNFLIPNINNVGIIPTINGSYNNFVSLLINNYVNFCIEQNIEPNNYDFLEYVKRIKVSERTKDGFYKELSESTKYDSETEKIFFDIFEKVIDNEINYSLKIEENNINKSK